MLQLAKNSNLITSEAELPSVKFFDGIVNDQTADLNDLVLKIQNNLIPLKEAIMQANDITAEQAEIYLKDSLESDVENSTQNLGNDRNGNNTDS